METELGALNEALEAAADGMVCEAAPGAFWEQDPFSQIRGGSDGKAAILGALEEAIVEERGVAGACSTTEVFAALMTALEASAGSTARNDLISLAEVAIPGTNVSLLRSKFDLIAGILTASFAPPPKKAEQNEEGAGVAKHAVRCLALVLVRQEASDAAWAAPVKVRALDAVLRACADKRPKVRKAAVNATVELLEASSGGQVLSDDDNSNNNENSAVAKRVVRWSTSLLAKLGGGADGAAQLDETPAAAFHLVQLILEIASADSGLAAKHRREIADALLRHALGRSPQGGYDGGKGRQQREDAWRFEALALRALTPCCRLDAALLARSLAAVRRSTLDASADVAAAWAAGAAALLVEAQQQQQQPEAKLDPDVCDALTREAAEAILAHHKKKTKKQHVAATTDDLFRACLALARRGARVATVRELVANLTRAVPPTLENEDHHGRVAALVVQLVDGAPLALFENALAAVAAHVLAVAEAHGAATTTTTTKAYHAVFETAVATVGVRRVLALVTPATHAATIPPAAVPVFKRAMAKHHGASVGAGNHMIIIPGVYLADFETKVLPLADPQRRSSVARSAVWSLAPLFVAHAADLELKLPEMVPALTEMLHTTSSSDDVADAAALRRTACDCCAALKKTVEAGPRVAAAARSLLPPVLATTMAQAEGPVDHDDSALETAATGAIEALALAADGAFVNVVFKKLLQRLLAAVADGRATKASRKRGAEDMEEEENGTKDKAASAVATRRAAALCGAAAAMVPALEPRALDMLWRAARPLVASDADVALQKRAYKLVLALCSDGHALTVWLLDPNQDGLKKVIDALLSDGSLHACHVACRERRLRVLSGVIAAGASSSASNGGGVNFIDRVVVPLAGEVILCLKDANAKARGAAFAALDAMALACHRDGERRGAANELPRVLIGALGARTPHMRSAAMVALARVCYEYRASLLDTFPDLLETAFLLLRDTAREVAKATLAFVHVAVLALAAARTDAAEDRLLPLLPRLVEALMLWAHEKKARFRAKVKLILRRLCRAYGHDAILPLVPLEDAPLVQHLKRAEHRAAVAKKRKRENAKQARSAASQQLQQQQQQQQQTEGNHAPVQGEEALVDEAKLFRDDFDEDVGDSSDDEKDDDDHHRASTRQQQQKAARPTQLSKKAAQPSSKKQRRLFEKGGEVMDLLGQASSSSNPEKRNRDGDDDDPDAAEANVAFDKSGKMIVGADDFPKKSALPASPAPGRRGNSSKAIKRTGKQGDTRNKRLMRKKKAGGDVQKHGALQPYKWAPLGDLVSRKKQKKH